MRILLLIPSMVGCGGTERMVHSLTILFQSLGHKVFLASFDSPSDIPTLKPVVPFYRLGSSSLLFTLRPLTYLISSFKLRLLKKQLDIDLTISNLWRADLINQLSLYPDLKISLCHINIVGNPSNTLMLRFLPMVSRIYRLFTRVVTVSRSLKCELQTLYKLSEKHTIHINNFVYPSSITSVTHVSEKKVFVWCGRMVPEKNIHGLLHSWRLFSQYRSDVQLVLLGSGPLFKDLLELARSLGLTCGFSFPDQSSSIIFVGPVDNPFPFLSHARALLLSSTSEGTPLVILEALSIGLPVLASDSRSGGVRATLLHEGACNPDMKSIQFTSCGALLPVPRNDNPLSLRLWHQCLQRAVDDDQTLSRWSQGASQRFHLFSPDHARLEWSALLETLPIHS